MVPDSPSAPVALSESLRALASAHGVQLEYIGHDGATTTVTEGAVVTVLAALGVDASSDDAIAAALIAADEAPWRAMVPATTVMREGSEPTIVVHVNDGDPVSVWVECEDGSARSLQQVDRWVPPREIDGTWRGRATFRLPADLPLGYHVLTADSLGTTASGHVIVCPDQAPVPAAATWGLMAQLYSVRSRRSWGIGDAADLADLAYVAASVWGADFVLINPLHAAEPVVPLTPSPYLPVTRQFFAPAYIRPEAVPEAAYLTTAQRAAVIREARVVRPANETAQLLDRDASWRAKVTALRTVFEVPRSTARDLEFAAFRRTGGQALEDFALWSVLRENLGQAPWPVEYASPDAPGSVKAREDSAAEITFQIWLQWIVEQQLEAAQQAAVAAGMRIGIVEDLAVGIHPQGSDVWAQGDLLATGVSVGAPPDMYNQLGQDWSQPPWRPSSLENTGYGAFRAVVRAAMRHSGAVRVDHILGLFRLWWVPQGRHAADGAYVTYNHEALIGILCLEAQRHGVTVIGEDLGTFEHWVSDYLAARGLLGTSVLWFERGWDGRPLAPEQYRRMALATVTTHDLPPTAGYLAGEHVRLRAELGLLTKPVEEELAAARAEREDVAAMLVERGLLAPGAGDEDVVVALHRYLAATPSLLRGVSLADMVGERRTQNQPGTDQEYPNWKIPLGGPDGASMLLDDVVTVPLAQRIAEAMNAGR